jgi:hypothetical protein
MTSDSRLVMTSLRLQPEMHEQLRRIAFDKKRSLHSLLIEGAHIAAEKYSATAQTREQNAS